MRQKRRLYRGLRGDALLSKLLDPFDGVLVNFTVWTLSNNGEKYGQRQGTARVTDDRWSIDSFRDMEHQLNSLRSLVCDLLKTNQELRDALKARSGVPNNQGS